MLEIRPITLHDANAYVEQNHRHNMPTQGHKFSIACYSSGQLCGVAIAGRPVSRVMDDGLTIEILRVCTDGTRNACSFLYGACVRCAKAMGYRRVITYTLKSEPGSSLKASGFSIDGETRGTNWDTPARRRQELQIDLFGAVRKYPDENKVRWIRKV